MRRLSAILITMLLCLPLAAQLQVVYTRSGASTVANPTFSPVSPYTGGATSVTISETTAGAIVYYCTDGTNLCTPSTQYSTPLSFSSTEFIRAQAVLLGGPSSSIVSWQGTFTTSQISVNGTLVSTNFTLTVNGSTASSTAVSSITVNQP